MKIILLLVFIEATWIQKKLKRNKNKNKNERNIRNISNKEKRSWSFHKRWNRKKTEEVRGSERKRESFKQLFRYS